MPIPFEDISVASERVNPFNTPSDSFAWNLPRKYPQGRLGYV